MNTEELKQTIMRQCIECVHAWMKDNWEQPVDIDYEDYVNYCWQYGGDKVKRNIDTLVNEFGDEQLQDFYDEVSYECEKTNRGVRSAIGKRIEHLRCHKGLTQQQLSEKAGLTLANIRNIELGRYNVTVDVLDKIALALDCTLRME